MIFLKIEVFANLIVCRSAVQVVDIIRFYKAWSQFIVLKFLYLI